MRGKQWIENAPVGQRAFQEENGQNSIICKRQSRYESICQELRERKMPRGGGEECREERINRHVEQSSEGD